MLYLSQNLLRDVHNLLWRSRALDQSGGEGEDAVALFEVTDGLPGLVHVGGAVVGANARGLKGIQKTFDLN